MCKSFKSFTELHYQHEHMGRSSLQFYVLLAVKTDHQSYQTRNLLRDNEKLYCETSVSFIDIYR